MITAIIVNYHSHLLTARAAASVLTDQPDAQVIVVDNSESEAEAQALRLALPPLAELVVSPHNIGFGRACNLGYGQACHDWILLLNPDAFVLHGCIDALVGFMLKNPQAGAVAPLAYWDEARTWLLPPGQLPGPATEFALTLAQRYRWLGTGASHGFRRWALQCLASPKAVEQRMLSGGHLLVSRTALDRAGGLFDPDFFMYFEDTDLCQRLYRSGFRLYLLPEARVVHEWRATQDKNGLMRAGQHQYFQKHFPDSRLSRWSAWLRKRKPFLSLPASRDLGLCRSSPVFPPPSGPHAEWLLELSPQPLLIPAMYYFGNNKSYQIPEELWNRLGAGQYWARISGKRGALAQTFCWRIGTTA